MKSKIWKEDRRLLRKTIREGKHEGLVATMLYCLLSHMRGKLHMSVYGKYKGGWRPWTRDLKVDPTVKLFPAWLKAYGPSSAAHYYARAAIKTLDDQWDWMLEFWEKMPEWFQVQFNGVFARVAAEYPDTDSQYLEGLKRRKLIKDYRDNGDGTYEVETIWPLNWIDMTFNLKLEEGEAEATA